MTKLLPCLAVLLALATPLHAREPMSAAEFEAYVEGRTLYFEMGGTAYGIEEYRPNRQVRWSFLNGECKLGSWYEQGERICFEYEDREAPQCWTFYRDGSGLEAQFADDPPGSELYGTRETTERLECLGPDVGA